jgi:NADH:quinone reductase (non-electrogenic)
MSNDQTQVLVLGAGYSGLLAAVRLAGKTRKQNVVITLVNGSDEFVERLRLHQFAANQPVARRPIAEVLRGTGIRFIQGHVTAIDPVGHEVTVQSGAEIRHIAFDKMIYALGSTIDRDSIAGVRENAYTLNPAGPRSAVELRQVLPALNAAGGRLVVVGGGPTGIEAAAEFAESYPNLHVQLVTRGSFGMFMNKGIAAYMRQALTRLGVTIQDHTTVTRIEAASIATSSGERIPFDLCLWAGGFSVPPLAREAGLAVNERGQVLIDPFMRSISHPDIFAVGDAAKPVEDPGVPVRMAALTSIIMGAHGADSLSALLHGKTPQPFSFAYLGQGIALGRHDAIGLNNYPDDKPRPPYFTGRLGYEGRELFVRLLADLPNIEKRLPGATIWLGKGRYAAARRRAQRRLRAAHV